LVSDIPARDGKIINLFLQCTQENNDERSGSIYSAVKEKRANILKEVGTKE
jgi:hypothetical protein